MIPEAGVDFRFNIQQVTKVLYPLTWGNWINFMGIVKIFQLFESPPELGGITLLKIR